MKRRAFVLGLLAAACHKASDDASTDTRTTPSSPPPDKRMPPADLAAQLARPGAKPAVLHVGFERLYRQGHIPSSVYAGEGGSPDGLAAIARAASPLPRGGAVVLYCGCCPWKNCPNIRPAYEKLVAMGFTDVRVLDIPTRFAADWADKGYPVEKG